MERNFITDAEAKINGNLTHSMSEFKPKKVLKFEPFIECS